MIVNKVVGVDEQEDGTYVYSVVDGERAQGWHLYVFNDGSAHLYTKVSPYGSLLGKPINLPAGKKKIIDVEREPIVASQQSPVMDHQSVLESINVISCALADHHHKWSREERASYHRAVREISKYALSENSK